MRSPRRSWMRLVRLATWLTLLVIAKTLASRPIVEVSDQCNSQSLFFCVEISENGNLALEIR